MPGLQPVPINQGMVAEGGKVSGDWARWLRDLVNAVDSAGGGPATSAAKLDPGAEINGVLFTGESNITIEAEPAGIVPLDKGGTDADLSATGGAGQMLFQEGIGDPVTVRAIADTDLPIIPVDKGGTGADLSATGGAGEYVKQATTGGNFTVGVIPTGDLPTNIPAINIADGSVDNTEFQYLDGARSNIQEQIDTKLFKFPFFKWWAWVANPFNATIAGVVNTGAINQVGTPTVTSTSFGFFVTRTTTTTLGNTATWNHSLGANEVMRSEWDLTLEVDFLTPSDITGLMYFIGWAGGNAPPNSGTGVNADYCAFRYLAGTDPGWVALTNDGTIANQTITDLATAIVADTRYRLKIVFTGAGTSADFYIDNVLVGTVTTFLPTPTLSMGLFAQTTNRVGGVGTARSMSMSSAYWEMGV